MEDKTKKKRNRTRAENRKRIKMQWTLINNYLNMNV